MNSLLLFCACDSVITHLSDNVMQNTVTNDHDVEITRTICWSIVGIVFIFVAGFLIWKQIDHHAKMKAEIRKQTSDKENSSRKQEAELFEKKLDILKELCYEYQEKEPKKVIKDVLSIQNYLNTINKKLGLPIENISFKSDETATTTTDNG